MVRQPDWPVHIEQTRTGHPGEHIHERDAREMQKTPRPASEPAQQEKPND